MPHAASRTGSGPSIRDVARRAGVSVSTVSRYLNGQLNLSDQTEKVVIDAVSSLGYSRPNRRGRAESSRTATIGIVIPQVGHPYFGPLVDYLVAAAESHGYSAIIMSTLSHHARELDSVTLIASKSISGLVYVGNFTSNPALARVISSGLPVVVIDEDIADIPEVDTVLVDDYAGAYHATSHLLALGHQRIGLLTGNPELASVRERTRGYIDALDRAGIDPDAQFRLHGQFTEDFGVAALSHILASGNSPTAVFAASDTIALGLIRAAHTIGVSIPDELSVVGFDDVPSSSLITPRLTTIHTPIDRMAAAALDALATRINDPALPPRRTVVPVTFEAGGSSRRLGTAR